MIAKENRPFCVTVLTNYGKQKLLQNNTNFLPEYFCFLDDEVNYELFNDDNLVQKGFDHVDSDIPDKIDDVASLGIRDALPRFDVSPVSYVFGDIVPHQLTQAQVVQEADLVVDMTADPIVSTAELAATELQRKVDVKFVLVSGGFGPYILSDAQFHNWNVVIDLRAVLTFYNEDGTTTIVDESVSESGFSNSQYFLTFQGGTLASSFVDTQSDLYITLDRNYIQQKQQNVTQGYGVFFIYKTITYNGQQYQSSVFQISIQEPQYNIPVPSIDGNATIKKQYIQKFSSKNIYFYNSVDTETLIDPKILANYQNNLLLNQVQAPGYFDFSKNNGVPLSFGIKGSSINSLHLKFQNLLSGTTYNLIDIIGDTVDSLENYVTIPMMNITLNLRKRVTTSGYYIVPTLELPDTLGFLSGHIQEDEVDSYYLLGDLSLGVHITTYPSVFLGNVYDYDALDFEHKLWQLICTDHTIAFNYDPTNILTMNNYESLIFYTA